MRAIQSTNRLSRGLLAMALGAMLAVGFCGISARAADDDEPELIDEKIFRKIMTDTRTQIAALLTPDQLAKWRQMGPGRNHKGEGHGHPEGSEAPPPGAGDPSKT